MPLQHIRTSTLDKRPVAANLSDGQLAVNYNTASPGLFFKDSNNVAVKIGPIHVGTTAPNVSPAGASGNSAGEGWLDTSGGSPVLKVWTGSTWASINSAGGVGVTTSDVGTVTSTMIADGTILNADINASAAIAHSKLANITAGRVLLGNASNVPTATALSGDVTVSNTGVTAIGTGVVVNTDINASAAIAHSKLANITAGQVLLGNASNIPTATALSGDVTVSSTGVTAIAAGVIVNADINASAAIADTKLATISTAGKVSNSATTATNLSTASAIVARDGSGNFSAGTITAALTGNAATATKLSSSRTFGLTGDVTGTVSSDLTSGASIAASIAAGVIVNADINASAAIADTKLATISTAGKVSNSATTGTDANTASAIVARDASGNFNTTSINSGPLAGFRNAIINGSFALAQRGTSFVAAANNDDSYNLDRWYVLSDGNDIVDITQNTATVPTNGKYAIALDVETVNKKFGIAQIIEADNCIGLIGDQVTLSFKARVSSTTNLDNVKAAIVAWSGTADTVTSDIVSAWNVEGTNPTLVANATYENTPANLNLTTSYATYSVTATVDTASTKNIVVFIWSDVTTTSLAEFLYITDVQLEAGPVATPFERRPIGTELALCQRYYYRITGDTGSRSAAAYCTSATEAIALLTFSTTMRTTPSAIETTGTAANYSVARTVSASACNAVPAYSSATTQGVGISLSVASGLTAGDGAQLRFAAAGAFIGVDTEL